jgi:hypothetical protein
MVFRAHNTEFRKMVLPILLAILIALLPGCEKGPEPQPYKPLQDIGPWELLTEEHPLYPWEAGAIATELGVEAIPELEEMLFADDTADMDRRDICCVLAALGDPTSRDLLLKFLDQPLPDELTFGMYSAVRAAMESLGMIGDEICLERLTPMTTAKYWDDRNPNLTVKPQEGTMGSLTDAERTQENMRDTAMRAVSFVATKEAIAVLESCKTGDPVRDKVIQGTIDNISVLRKAYRKEGRREYFFPTTYVEGDEVY